MNFSKRKAEKAKRQPGPRFESREAAVAGMLDFRMSWEYGYGRTLYQRKKDDPIPISPGDADAMVPAGKLYLQREPGP